MESHSHDILSTKFDGKNYPMWEFHFRVFVQGKTCLESWMDQQLSKMKTRKNKFGTLTMLVLRPFNLAAEMWKHLKKGDKDIQSYYSGLMAIWSKQDQRFGGNLSSAGFKEVMFERKKTRVVEFLMKLRPDFEAIRANIPNRETLPDIDVVFGELIR
ncbi:hypothetical protein KY289_036521 [Solanum tuberosum]|nr:hypothetical protein KY289_036521 [Solanum tuberosum]